MKYLLKLGGSVITRKTAKSFPLELSEIQAQTETYMNKEAVEHLVQQIKEKREQGHEFIVICGVGPFGHYLATERFKGKDISVETIHKSSKIPGKYVLNALQNHGMMSELCPAYTSCYFTEKDLMSLKCG